MVVMPVFKMMMMMMVIIITMSTRRRCPGVPGLRTVDVCLGLWFSAAPSEAPVLSTTGNSQRFLRYVLSRHNHAREDIAAPSPAAPETGFRV